MFKPADRKKARLRLALDGPSGSGKTYTALRFAFCLAGKKGRVAVIDTEHGSSAKYLGEAPDGIEWHWDVVVLEPGQYSPQNYTRAIKAAGQNGYDVLVIDSLSHAWIGSGGALDMVDRSTSASSFTAWRDVTPLHNEMVESILSSPCHVLVTLRSKMAYAIETQPDGKIKPVKVGLKPIQREGIEYEFDLVCDLSLDHIMRVTKSRCPLVDGAIVHLPTGDWIFQVRDWLNGEVKPPTFESPQQPEEKEKPKPSKRDKKKPKTSKSAKPQEVKSAEASEQKPSNNNAPTPEQIKSMARAAGIPPVILKKKIKDRGFSSLAAMTADARADLLGEIKRMVKDMEVF